MNTHAPFETRQEILSQARERGYLISATQLVRWHRAGLLPRPHQQPLKEARGTCSLYPPGTSEQVLLLCSLRPREHRLSQLAWLVWLVGYRVDDRIIRTQLQQATARISGWMQWFAGFKQAVRQQDAEQTLNLIERYAQGRLRSQPVRRIRKRIGCEHFSTFLSRLLELAVEDNEERASPADEHEQQFDLRLLARGLGLEKRFVRKKDALDYYLVQFLLPQLHWFFHWSQEVRWEDLLEHVDAFEVLQARDELRTWLMGLEKGRHSQDRLPNDYPGWQIDLLEIFRTLSTADQALVLVAWLALRTLSSSQLNEMPAITIGPNGPSYVN